MKLLYSNDVLRRKIASDPDDEPTAGDNACMQRFFRECQKQSRRRVMTTTVQIVVPKPNHKRVRVQVVNPADGTEYPGKPAVTVEHGTVHTEYVHSGQRLIIDEID